MPSGVVAVEGAHGEGLLPDAGQIAEQIFGVFALFIGVEPHIVDTGKPQYGQFVVR